ncbi:MAG: molecular chaperone HtpG [Synergistaceae bacterium]|jgi:molecular chaperone HtpG|nr:molecular chaperone HtpG [Synergistaceae bacterium]MDD2349961.1 molecular chaperone HtpG [Synergistaceae bacterium]MDD3319191.1 molecular chaperone HtpG [Synergistaceae bacterium]MDD3672770.1 molecular chaperone HtpG [Synergistaceae bacterium]MDD3963882.1 molecular chaperone HtpG [Synergistaceae bacterium]
MSQNIEKHEFQSEAKQVLELMINSVYSNPDIFLRELISNASDALDKLRIESLSNTDLSDLVKDGEIRIEADKDSKTLTVSDNGIGMEREDLVSYLGTIARSGTKEFVKAMQEAASSKNGDLIGQFGVGFYSSFIAADKVTVETKKAGSDKSWIWESEGDGTYTISEGSRESNGTTITLHIKEMDKDNEASKDYLSEWTLRGIIKQYSDFVTYPIYLEDKSKEKKEDVKDEPVNSMKALWTRPENEVSEDEYKEFYRHLTHDWEDPMDRISYKAEGSSEFRALLYIPSRPPVDLFFQEGKHGVQLYIRRVFIMSDCRELIPEYLRFIKGVVDSEDLSLNISREILQQDRQTAMIKSSITRKVLDALKKMKADRPDEYKKFWQIFGMVLKEGIISDTKNREQIMKLCLLDSSKGEKTTLEEYVSRMADGQKNIYYITGGPVKNLEISPKIEGLKKKNIEVLLLGDAVDEIWVNHARKFNEYDFVSVSQEDIALPEGSEFENAEGKEELEKTGFISKLKESLANIVEDVKISTRLVDSPACFVQKGEPISPQMRNFFRSMGQDVPEEKKVLEVNPSHPLIKKIASETEKGNADVAEWANVLMGLAAICEGEPVEDGKKFTRLITKLLDK